MRITRSIYCIVGVWIVGIGAFAAAPTPELGVIQGIDRFEFTYRVKLPELTKTGHLWLPLAKTDAFQTVEIKEITTPSQWKKIQDRDYGNNILFLSPSPSESGKMVEIRYQVSRLEKESYTVKDIKMDQYLHPERLVPINETFKSIALEKIKNKKNDLERGKVLYDHVFQSMRYDKSGTGWGRGDALYACNAHTGNCTDFHAYFIALARSVGIPARFAIGATIPSDKNEGPIGGYHCWAEFFAEGRWVPVDISEASKKPELADYYFGHHPANRFEFSAGRDLVVEPGPVAGPINFLVYPILEVDGKIVETKAEFSFRRTKPSSGS